MKFKYYMRGFGAGLIIATIVLMVAGKIQNNNKALVTDNNENQRTGSVSVSDSAFSVPSV